MAEEMCGGNWYALFVATGEEDNVKERLNFRFKNRLKILVPKRKLRERRQGQWHEITRVLFPGYVLLNGNIGNSEYNLLKDVPGLIKLLKSGYEPLCIDSQEIDIISRLIVKGETIGFSSILVEEGRVVVCSGPLSSLEGQIVSINKRKGRARVKLNFLGEERTVEVGVEVLQKVDDE